MSAVSEYRYVEVADGGIDHRGKVRLVEQVDGMGKTDQYATYGRATIELQTWLQSHQNKDGRPTTAGFSGAIWTPYLHLDFDAKDDLEKALGWIRRTYQRLIDMGVPVDAPRLFFSGAKGFHLELPAALFGGFEPSAELHRALKAAATLILRGIPFDPSVYNKLRLWRLENSLNSKGRFKIRLTPGELLQRSLAEIQALALAVRQYPEADIDADDWLPVPDLIEIWHQAQVEASKPASSGPAAALGDDERDRLTAAAIGASWPRLDEQGARPVRHEYLLALGGFLARRTSEEHVARLLKAGAAASGDDEREWDEEIDRIAASCTEKAAKGDPMTGLPRLAERFPGLAKTLGVLWPATELEPPDSVSFGNESANGEAGASEHLWPMPDPIFDPPPAPVLPLEHFPQEIADVASDAAERIQAPPDFIAWPLVVSAAGLIGREASIRPRAHDDWSERPCIWFLAVGSSGTGKTPAQEAGTRPLRRQAEANMAAHREAMADWKQRCKEIRAATPKGEKPELPPRPALPRCLTSDATVEKIAVLLGVQLPGGEDDDAPEPTGTTRGLALYRDELAGLLADMNKYRERGGDRQFFLQAFSGGPYTVDRISRPGIFVPDLLLNVLGGMQPEIARDLFGSGPRDGLAARFLASWPEPSTTWTHVDRWPNRAALDALDRINDQLAAAHWADLLWMDDFKPTPFCRLDSSGQDIFDQWHTGHMLDVRSGQHPDRLTDRFLKYPGQAARLALVFHLIEWAAGRVPDPRVVSGELIARVLDLMDDYVRPMDTRIYAAYAVTAEAEGGRRIARWIVQERKRSLTAREVRRHEWTGLQEPKAVSAALEWLAAHRWLREVEGERRAGRPSELYVVNPRALEDSHG